MSFAKKDLVKTESISRESITIAKDEYGKLITSYSDTRAKKDGVNENVD